VFIFLHPIFSKIKKYSRRTMSMDIQ
jgi:hypothetical protein